VDGVTRPDLDHVAARACTRPTPSVTCSVCPTACRCHAVRAPGAKCTLLARIREGSSPREMTSNHTSPVNHSAGPFDVGAFFTISTVLLLAVVV
jgi:hypothetical protein